MLQIMTLLLGSLAALSNELVELPNSLLFLYQISDKIIEEYLKAAHVDIKTTCCSTLMRL